MYVCRSPGRAEKGYIIGVASKASDVLAYPSQRGTLVVQT